MATDGADGETQTHDLLITSQLLYQLSYTGRYRRIRIMLTALLARTALYVSVPVPLALYR